MLCASLCVRVCVCVCFCVSLVFSVFSVESTAQKLSDGRPGPQLRVAAVQTEGQGGKRGDSDWSMEAARCCTAHNAHVQESLPCFSLLNWGCLRDLYLPGTRGARASPLCVGASFSGLRDMI